MILKGENQMIMQAEQKKYYTADEYLDFEVNSEQRHEYINGEILN